MDFCFLSLKRFVVSLVCISLSIIGSSGCDSESTSMNDLPPIGGQDTGGQTAGGQSNGGQTTGGQSTGGQTAGGQTTGGQTTGGQDMGGQNTGGQNTGGQNTGGQMGGEMEEPAEVLVTTPFEGEALCEESILLTCASGTQRFNTANGQTSINNYVCEDTFNFPGKDLFFEFQHNEPITVRITTQRTDPSFAVSYLLFALDSQNQCDRAQAPCIDFTDTTSSTLPFEFNFVDTPILLSYDPRVNADDTTEFD